MSSLHIRLKFFLVPHNSLKIVSNKSCPKTSPVKRSAYPWGQLNYIKLPYNTSKNQSEVNSLDILRYLSHDFKISSTVIRKQFLHGKFPDDMLARMGLQSMPKVQHRSSPLDLSQQVEAAKWSKRDCLYLPLCFINIFTTEWPMPLMSSPLAATSVATRTRMRPCFKPFKAWSRALWSCTKWGTFEFSPCPIQFRTKNNSSVWLWF